MTFSTRIALLLCFFSLCAGGTILVSMDRAKKPVRHAEPTRVMNRAVRRNFWLRA
jgi:hypothetical protein